jgi:hypothetical protein
MKKRIFQISNVHLHKWEKWTVKNIFLRLKNKLFKNDVKNKIEKS